MSKTSPIETFNVKSSVGNFKCAWCGQAINKTEPFTMFRFFENANPEMKKSHNECIEPIVAAFNNGQITHEHEQSNFKRGECLKSEEAEEIKAEAA